MNKKVLSIGGTFLAAAVVAVLLTGLRKAMAVNAGGLTLQIGFENSVSEPIGQALEKWKQLVED